MDEYKNQPVIVHIHILKNAGTTIDWILQKNFGENSKFFDHPDPYTTLDQKDLLNFLSIHKETKSVSSFQISFPYRKKAISSLYQYFL